MEKLSMISNVLHKSFTGVKILLNEIHRLMVVKVEKILEDSLDSFPSPSVKIQIIGGKVYLR